MDQKRKALIGLNVSVFLVGVTGLFAKLISTSVCFIVFGRVLFASMALVLFLKIRKEKILPRSMKDAAGFIVLGVILTFHWFAFFYSIKISTVAIGLLTFSTFPVFTTFLEPIFFKGRLKLWDILVAIICCIGVWFIVPDIDLSQGYSQGIIWGVLSGLFYAFVLLLNKGFVARYSAVNLTFYQCFVAMIVLFPVVLGMQETVLALDWLYLFVNGVICTALAHTLYIFSARYVDAKTISILTMMELFYGIVLAYFILGEGLDMRMALGGSLIVIASYLSVRKSS